MDNPVEVRTYTIKDVKQGSECGYVFGGCLHDFCWRKNREGIIFEECDFYQFGESIGRGLRQIGYCYLRVQDAEKLQERTSRVKADRAA